MSRPSVSRSRWFTYFGDTTLERGNLAATLRSGRENLESRVKGQQGVFLFLFHIRLVTYPGPLLSGHRIWILA